MGQTGIGRCQSIRHSFIWRLSILIIHRLVFGLHPPFGVGALHCSTTVKMPSVIDISVESRLSHANPEDWHLKSECESGCALLYCTVLGWPINAGRSIPQHPITVGK